MSTSNARRVCSGLDESSLFDPRLTLVSARNSEVVLADPTGARRSYIDFMSAYGAVSFGHCNPAITTSHACADLVACFSPPHAESVARWLCERLALPNHRILYQVGGSFAVSTALALAQRVRPGGIVAIRGAFHGLGVDSLATTTTQKELALHAVPALTLPHVARHLDPGELPVDWSTTSALIFEPVQGAAGYVPLDPGWLEELVRRAQRAGVIVISDEIQAGFYRHGHLSVARAQGLHPDILLFGKSLTNGLFPTSAVVFHDEIEARVGRSLALAHTFQTSALGFAAADAVTRYIDGTPVAAMCTRIHERLAALVERISGAAVISSAHVTGPSASFAVHGGSRAFVRACFEAGLIVFPGGSHGERVRIAPPLTVEDEVLDTACEIMVRATMALTASC